MYFFNFYILGFPFILLVAFPTKLLFFFFFFWSNWVWDNSSTSLNSLHSFSFCNSTFGKSGIFFPLCCSFIYPLGRFFWFGKTNSGFFKFSVSFSPSRILCIYHHHHHHHISSSSLVSRSVGFGLVLGFFFFTRLDLHLLLSLVLGEKCVCVCWFSSFTRKKNFFQFFYIIVSTRREKKEEKCLFFVLERKIIQYDALSSTTTECIIIIIIIIIHHQFVDEFYP